MGRGEDEQAEVTNNFLYEENTQPVQFPPPQPQPQPQPEAYPPPQQGQPQAYPPQQGQPQAYPPQQGQPQAYPPPQQGQPQAYPPPQQGQPQTYLPPQQGQPQAYRPTGVPVSQATGEDGWSSDLFDCMDNPENAIITACFPCVTYGQIAELVDNGQSSCATSGSIYGLIAIFLGCPCIISCSIRSKLRNRYGLAESPAPDWVTHCFCEWCALCQEYRELTSRGLDPAIGWEGNVKKQQNIQMQQQATMTPPMNQTMM